MRTHVFQYVGAITLLCPGMEAVLCLIDGRCGKEE